MGMDSTIRLAVVKNYSLYGGFEPSLDINMLINVNQMSTILKDVPFILLHIIH